MKISVDHEFFNDQKCDVIKLYPNQNESNLWTSLNLHFKKINENSWSVFIGMDEKDKRKLQIFLDEDSLILNVKVQTDKSKFLNYTYWSYAFNEDLCVLRVPSRGENNKIQINIAKNDLKILDRIIINGGLKKHNLMQLEIDIKEELLRLLLEKEKFKYSRVELTFDVIQIFLEYVFIRKNKWDPENMVLIDNSGQLEFTPLQEINYFQNEKAYLSRITKPVKLNSQYPYCIQLWYKKQAKRQLIFADIPIPDILEESIQSGKSQKIITKYIYY